MYRLSEARGVEVLLQLQFVVDCLEARGRVRFRGVREQVISPSVSPQAAIIPTAKLQQWTLLRVGDWSV